MFDAEGAVDWWPLCGFCGWRFDRAAPREPLARVVALARFLGVRS